MAHLGLLKMMEINAVSRFFDDLSNTIGFPVSSLRFYAAVLACYPLALFSRRYVIHSSPSTQHLFYTAAGLSLGYFNFGLDCMHYIVTIIANFLLLQLLGGTRKLVAASLVYNMGYLLSWYFVKIEAFHKLTWDTPQCIICLKMIGMAFDVYDGQKPDKKLLNKDQQQNYIPRLPTLMEICGYTFFFAGFMSGPQFCMRQYLLLTNRQLLPKSEMQNPSNLRPAAIRFGQGLIYVAMMIFFLPIYSETYLRSKEFKNSSFLNQFVSILLWGMFQRSMYITSWIMADGSCILTGLGYNGIDKNGKTRWNFCQNVRVRDYETSLSFRDLIASYNVKTNHWARRQIFQRLRFLNSKALSQLLTLLFLASWHGPFTGYFHAFVFEFFELLSEDSLAEFWHMLGFKPLASYPRLYYIAFPFLRLLMLLGFGYPFVSFQFLVWSKYNEFYASVYYFGHIIFIGLPLFFILVIKPLHRLVSFLSSGRPKSE